MPTVQMAPARAPASPWAQAVAQQAMAQAQVTAQASMKGPGSVTGGPWVGQSAAKFRALMRSRLAK